MTSIELTDYKCPHLTNGWEYREFGSGWAYGTIDQGLGSGNTKFRFKVLHSCNMGHDISLIYEFL